MRSCWLQQITHKRTSLRRLQNYQVRAYMPVMGRVFNARTPIGAAAMQKRMMVISISFSTICASIVPSANFVCWSSAMISVGKAVDGVASAQLNLGAIRQELGLN
jgi:hypothetical protein